MREGYTGRFEPLRNRTKDFALRIIRVFRALPKADDARVIGKQMLRSGTSVGANYRAVCRARSRRDFVSKMGIVLEEADETAFWLELLADSGIVSEKKLSALLAETNELVKIFAASLRTAQNSKET